MLHVYNISYISKSPITVPLRKDNLTFKTTHIFVKKNVKTSYTFKTLGIERTHVQFYHHMYVIHLISLDILQTDFDINY